MSTNREDAERHLYDDSEYASNTYHEDESHVPTTTDVRATYATDYYMVEVGSRGTPLGRAAAFDRWLAEHDRAVAAAAWDAGWNEGVDHEVYESIGQERPNPYRSTPTGYIDLLRPDGSYKTLDEIRAEAAAVNALVTDKETPK